MRGLLRPVRKLYLGAAAAVTVATLITLAGPALVRYAVDAGIKKHDTHPLNVAALIFIGLAVVKPFVVRAQILLSATAGERFLDSLRVAAFDKLQALPLGFFERERAGVLVSRLTSDVQSLNELVRDALIEIAGSGLQIVLTVVALVFLSPKLALISLVALPILIASSWSFHHGAGRAYRTIRDRVAETLTVLQEGLAGVRVVQAFRREAQTLDRYRAAEPGPGERVAARVVRQHPALRVPAARAVGGADRRAADGGVRCTRTGRDLDRDDHGVRALSGAAVRSDRALHGVARRVPAGTRGARGRSSGCWTCRARSRSIPTRSSFRAKARSRLRDVTFGYSDGAACGPWTSLWSSRPANMLRSSARRARGSRPSAKLLDAPVRPAAGRDRARRHRHPQCNARVASPAYRAAAAGGPSVQRDDRGQRAARSSGGDGRGGAECAARHRCARTVRGLPNGLATDVQTRGVRLSAGERQLVGIARVALADPAVIVLDEATSSLDPATEAEVERALAAVAEGRTVVTIAHRLSTAERADRVAVMEHGRLVEVASHDELVEQGDRYARLWASWQAGLAAPA